MSKPKEIRVCAFCGYKEHKSKLLRVLLPDLNFDFYQNINSRSFYVCQNSKCISRVIKKKSVNKFLENYENIDLLQLIKEQLSHTISKLFMDYKCDNIDSDNLFLYSYNLSINSENCIKVNKMLYKDTIEMCIIKDKKTAERLKNYKKIITYTDGF